MSGAKIVNMVAIASLSSPLNLDMVAEALPNTEQCKSAVKWLKYRIGPKKKYIAFYKSGKFLITGATSRDEVHRLAEQVVKQLVDHGISVEVMSVKVNNIVVLGEVNLTKSLENLIHILDSTKAAYEPEQFPGFVYKDWGVNFLLFSSGKFVITGIKNEGDIELVVKKFKHLVEESAP